MENFNRWFIKTFNNQYHSRLEEARRCPFKKAAVNQVKKRYTYLILAFTADEKVIELREKVTLWESLSKEVQKLPESQAELACKQTLITMTAAVGAWEKVCGLAINISEKYYNMLGIFLRRSCKSNNIEILKTELKNIEIEYQNAMSLAQCKTKYCDSSSNEAILVVQKLLRRSQESKKYSSSTTQKVSSLEDSNEFSNLKKTISDDNFRSIGSHREVSLTNERNNVSTQTRKRECMCTIPFSRVEKISEKIISAGNSANSEITAKKDECNKKEKIGLQTQKQTQHFENSNENKFRKYINYLIKGDNPLNCLKYESWGLPGDDNNSNCDKCDDEDGTETESFDENEQGPFNDLPEETALIQTGSHMLSNSNVDKKSLSSESETCALGEEIIKTKDAGFWVSVEKVIHKCINEKKEFTTNTLKMDIEKSILSKLQRMEIESSKIKMKALKEKNNESNLKLDAATKNLHKYRTKKNCLEKEINTMKKQLKITFRKRKTQQLKRELERMQNKLINLNSEISITKISIRKLKSVMDEDKYRIEECIQKKNLLENFVHLK